MTCLSTFADFGPIQYAFCLSSAQCAKGGLLYPQILFYAQYGYDQVTIFLAQNIS